MADARRSRRRGARATGRTGARRLARRARGGRQRDGALHSAAGAIPRHRAPRRSGDARRARRGLSPVASSRHGGRDAPAPARASRSLSRGSVGSGAREPGRSGGGRRWHTAHRRRLPAARARALPGRGADLRRRMAAWRSGRRRGVRALPRVPRLCGVRHRLPARPALAVARAARGCADGAVVDPRARRRLRRGRVAHGTRGPLVRRAARAAGRVRSRPLSGARGGQLLRPGRSRRGLPQSATPRSARRSRDRGGLPRRATGRATGGLSRGVADHPRHAAAAADAPRVRRSRPHRGAAIRAPAARAPARHRDHVGAARDPVGRACIRQGGQRPERAARAVSCGTISRLGTEGRDTWCEKRRGARILVPGDRAPVRGARVLAPGAAAQGIRRRHAAGPWLGHGCP